MNNPLVSLACLVIIGFGAWFAYQQFIYLPEQQRVQQEQQQAQAAANAKAAAQFQSNMDAYEKCMSSMPAKESAWLDKQCISNPNDPMDIIKKMNCRSAAMSSSTAKQFDCPSPY